jgi:hypothetical protein
MLQFGTGPVAPSTSQVADGSDGLCAHRTPRMAGSHDEEGPCRLRGRSHALPPDPTRGVHPTKRSFTRVSVLPGRGVKSHVRYGRHSRGQDERFLRSAPALRGLTAPPTKRSYVFAWRGVFRVVLSRSEAAILGRPVYVVEAVRTPFGRAGGAYANVRPDDLAAHVFRSVAGRLCEQLGDISGEAMDEVVLGAANQACEDNRNVGRTAVRLAGLPTSVTGSTVNRLCASGLDAVVQAARAIAVGQADLMIAGGVESTATRTSATRSH